MLFAIIFITFLLHNKYIGNPVRYEIEMSVIFKKGM